MAKKISAKEKAWVQGYMCAVAMLINKEGCTSTYSEELFHEGISGGIQGCIDHEVDSQDLETLKLHFQTEVETSQ